MVEIWPTRSTYHTSQSASQGNIPSAAHHHDDLGVPRSRDRHRQDLGTPVSWPWVMTASFCQQPLPASKFSGCARWDGSAGTDRFRNKEPPKQETLSIDPREAEGPNICRAKTGGLLGISHRKAKPFALAPHKTGRVIGHRPAGPSITAQISDKMQALHAHHDFLPSVIAEHRSPHSGFAGMKRTLLRDSACACGGKRKWNAGSGIGHIQSKIDKSHLTRPEDGQPAPS